MSWQIRRNINLANLNAPDRNKKNVWDMPTTQTQKEKENNGAYREDVYMLYTSKIGDNEKYGISELLKGIKDAKIPPKDILGIQSRSTGIEVMVATENTYEGMLEHGIKIGEDVIEFSPKRKRSQVVKVYGLSMDVYDSTLKKALSAYGNITEGKKHQLRLNGKVDEEFGHVSNGDRVMYMTIDRNIPRRLLIANDWVTIWYVGQQKTCGKCGEEHKTEECTRMKCYKCNKTGHVAAKCNEPKRCYECGETGHEKAQCPETKKEEEDEEERPDEMDELDDINSPEYSPIKKNSDEECWPEKKIKEVIQKEKATDLFTQEELRQILEKITAEAGKGIKDESRRLTEKMELKKATETFVHHMRELNEITLNKSLNSEDKTKLKIEKHRWIYGTLIKMRNENIAGMYRGKMIIVEEKEKEARKRNAEEASPLGQNRKNLRC